MKTMKQEPKQSYKGKGYYSIFWHKFIIIIIAAVFLTLIILLFPYLLKFICVKYGDTYKDILPDFLGGLSGIIIGFVFEAILIAKWKRLDTYKGYVIAIGRELTAIAISLKNTQSEYFSIKLNYPVITSIVSDADKESVLNRLPSLFILFKYDRRFYNIIHDLNAVLKKHTVVGTSDLQGRADIVSSLRKCINEFANITKFKYNNQHLSDITW